MNAHQKHIISKPHLQSTTRMISTVKSISNLWVEGNTTPPPAYKSKTNLLHSRHADVAITEAIPWRTEVAISQCDKSS